MKRAAKNAARRTLGFVLALLLLSLAVFYLSRLSPGDPLRSYYGESAERLSESERADALDRLGLDRPIIVQYGVWLKNALLGDFGVSFQYKRDVMTVIGGVYGNTLLLGVTAYLSTFGLALLLGAFCALREDSPADRAVRRIGTVTGCIPSFWLALLLILLFSVELGLLPSSGAYDIGRPNDLLGRLRHLILPLAVLVLGHLWYYACLIRNRLLDEVRQDYVLLCRAEGLSRRKILFTQCLRNVLPSYFGLMAVSIPHILGGTYIVEKVFSYPGLGTLCFESAKYHDYNMLLVLCLITGAVVMLAGMAARALGGALDPRMRGRGAR